MEAGEDSGFGYSLQVGTHFADYVFVDVRYYYVEGVVADGVYAGDEEGDFIRGCVGIDVAGNYAEGPQQFGGNR